MKSHKVVSKKVVHDGFFRVTELELSYPTFQGETITSKQEYVERGNAVAVLLFETDTNSLLFSQQFRYAGTQTGNGWLLEIAAGMIDANETPQQAAQRELVEELGYQVKELTEIGTFYMSPGGYSEQITIYCASVQQSDKVAQGGGLTNESEDIALVKIPLTEFINGNALSQITDAKTMIAVQWLLMNCHKLKIKNN